MPDFVPKPADERLMVPLNSLQAALDDVAGYESCDGSRTYAQISCLPPPPPLPRARSGAPGRGSPSRVPIPSAQTS